MQKNCSMCGSQLTWYIEDDHSLARCPIHGQVAGVFRDQPLNFFDKIILRLQGIKFVLISNGSET